MRTRGFTLKELTVVLVLLALAAAAAAPAVEAARERDRRIVCANNLRIIWEGLRRYSNDNHGHYPRTRYDPSTADRPVAFTNPRTADPFADDGPKPNDVTAALYLVVRKQGVQPHAFVCPEIDPLGAAIQGAAGSAQVLQRLQQEQQQLKQANADLQWPPPPAGPATADDPASLSNFPDASNLSYSYANPYPSQRAAEAGFKLDYTSSEPLVADINPGGKDPLSSDGSFTAAALSANSPNHGGFGQNVLYSGGQVTWQPTPFCVTSRPSLPAAATSPRPLPDNIYTHHAGKPGRAEAAGDKLSGDPVVGAPMDQWDSVMLPVAGKKPAEPAGTGPLTDPARGAAPSPTPQDTSNRAAPQGRGSRK
jgi:prepilin-type N-terminal cleavage/methylation domain-containing protein